MAEPLIAVDGLSVRAGRTQLLRNLDAEIAPRQILGVIGPSGCGKTTFLRCLNRLIDLSPGLSVSGEVRFCGRSIRSPGSDADVLRAEVGMLFQQPVVFPGSIADNVVFGLRRVYRPTRAELPARIEKALRQAGLWSEVAARLDAPADLLSVGQQQRMCLARALAMEPRVLLLDEPTSSLDEAATAEIERLVTGLAEHLAIVMVTHDLAQARRVSERLLRFELRDGAGVIAEQGTTAELLPEPLVSVAEKAPLARGPATRNLTGLC